MWDVREVGGEKRTFKKNREYKIFARLITNNKKRSQRAERVKKILDRSS